MSPYELADLWVTHMTFLLSVFLAFISATSAFLIVATLKGRELQNFLYRLILYLYLIASVFFLLFFVKVSEGLFNLRTQMIDLEMIWYNVVYENQMILPVILSLGVLIMISLITGSVWYFNSVREKRRVFDEP